jgi:tetratricopeptide (TPR) repeat protein
LVLSDSRSGWIGGLFGIGYTSYYYLKNRKYEKILFVFFPLIIASLFPLLLVYKPNSSLGRKHIYSLSEQMLKQDWFSGIGPGKFRTQFNEYQAEFFSENNIDDKTALLADNTFYAFNDYLQWVIETGIAGLSAMAVIFYLLIHRIKNIRKLRGNKPIIIAATSSLLCIGIAALFSYPLQVIPIQAMTLVCIGIIIFYAVTVKGRLNHLTGIISKVFFSITAVLFFINSARVMQRKIDTKSAFELALTGYKKQAIAKYESLIKRFPRHGDIMYLYAEQLYYSNRLHEALSAINKARNYYVDNKLYILKANIEDALGKKREAESSYLHALYMVPNRMRSRFDLLNFYLNQKDSVNAFRWAKSIINMPVKIPSEKTERMLRETQKILQQIGK